MTEGALPGKARGSATFKARDVEELIDFYLHRRVANWVVRAVANTSVTPDQITVASGVTGACAGVVIGAATQAWHLALGAFLFFFAIVLDCSDGQLARLKGQSTFAGRALDGYVDVLATAAIFIGQFTFLLRHGQNFWLVWCLGWASGYAVKWHVHTYDHVKNVYLLNTEPPSKGADAYPSVEAIEKEVQEHLAAGRRFWALLARSFISFTLAQRKANDQKRDDFVAKTDRERLVYRDVYRVYMRLWSFAGLGTHLFLLVLTTLVCIFEPRAPLYAWAFLMVPVSVYTFALLGMRKGLAARYEAARAALEPAA
jgi:hypothetical protein